MKIAIISDFREMASATLAYTKSVLPPEDLEYLSQLPETAERVIDGTRFLLCHAAPSDRLCKYIPPNSGLWESEAERAATDVLLVEHTHKPFARESHLRLGRLRRVAEPSLAWWAYMNGAGLRATLNLHRCRPGAATSAKRCFAETFLLAENPSSILRIYLVDGFHITGKYQYDLESIAMANARAVSSRHPGEYGFRGLGPVRQARDRKRDV